ncbi:MAG: hypothetical protein M3401_05955 [Actinomycetota bacterium]|nr:hypothetical protein [Actinomycetota bacterium]
MTPSDAARARSRFLAALRRIAKGLETQRGRIMRRAAEAPKRFGGTDHEVTDLTGDPGNDLDYYIYELARLQDLARTISKTFGQPDEIVDALAKFDQAVPNLRGIRNPLTHPSDNSRLDGVAWFDSVVKLLPNGAVEYLVDPRYEHHDAALELSRALAAYPCRSALRRTCRSAFNLRPPRALTSRDGSLTPACRNH